MAVLRLALALCAAAALALSFAPAASAAPGFEVGIEDERLLLTEPHRAPEAVEAWRALGVDVVRIHARWFEIAPGRDDRRRPRGERYDWARLDQAVRLVRAAGMRVMLSVTGPGPLWTTRDPRRGNARYEPRPKLFGQFARQVARRYRAQVDRYLIWNEPNQAGWLQPQSLCTGRRGRRTCTPRAPHLYRELVAAAAPAIRKADPGAQILFGELAPKGFEGRIDSGGSALQPLPFLRAFGCVSERYKTLRSGQCRRFKAPAVDALGYHPHGVKNGPDRANPNPDSAQIADLPRLERVLDRLTRRGRIRSPGRRPLDLYLTEFSYQTSPPDRAVGVSLADQAVFQQQAAYLSWRNPRVRNLTQYQWDDEHLYDKGRGSKRYAGWQGGLRFLDGRPKPALAAFEAPFVVDVSDDGTEARLWGQVRPGEAYTITILRGTGSGTDLTPVTTVATDAHGTWTFPVALDGPARYAAAWTDLAGTARRTPVVGVEPRDEGRRLAAAPGL